MLESTGELDRALRRLGDGIAAKIAEKHPSLRADGPTVTDEDGQATIEEYGIKSGDPTGAMTDAVRRWRR